MLSVNMFWSQLTPSPLHRQRIQYSHHPPPPAPPPTNKSMLQWWVVADGIGWLHQKFFSHTNPTVQAWSPRTLPLLPGMGSAGAATTVYARKEVRITTREFRFVEYVVKFTSTPAAICGHSRALVFLTIPPSRPRLTIRLDSAVGAIVYVNGAHIFQANLQLPLHFNENTTSASRNSRTQYKTVIDGRHFGDRGVSIVAVELHGPEGEPVVEPATNFDVQLVGFGDIEAHDFPVATNRRVRRDDDTCTSSGSGLHQLVRRQTPPPPPVPTRGRVDGVYTIECVQYPVTGVQGPHVQHFVEKSDGELVEIMATPSTAWVSGQTQLSIRRGLIFRRASGDLEVSFDSRTRVRATTPTRRERRTVGSRTVLVLRVIATDASTTATVAELSDSVFGTSGDPVNLASQMSACSYGQLTMIPYSGTTSTGVTISGGVVEVPINTYVGGRSKGSIDTDITNAATALLGSLGGQFDHVMYCVPPGSSGSWIGYGVSASPHFSPSTLKLLTLTCLLVDYFLIIWKCQ